MRLAAAFSAVLLSVPWGVLGGISLGVGGTALAAPPSGYRLTFAAEFDDPHVKLSVREGGPFTTRYESWGGLRTLPGNQEEELYVDRDFVPSPTGTDAAGHNDGSSGSAAPLGIDPFHVEDGVLGISAVRLQDGLRQRLGRNYASGLLSTEWSFAQRFGYFEIRAQMPRGRGLWPAFWMVSKTQAEHAEIDVVEAIGGDDAHVYQSVHTTRARGSDTHLKVTRPGLDTTDGMHVYGLLWTASELVFSIDGMTTARTDGASLRTAPPMYLLVNLAVGGTWPGSPDAATAFPATLRVDYIRAYATP